MYTIFKNGELEIEIKKSRFLTKIYKVYQLEEVTQILNCLHEEFQDATHICYAYRMNNTVKFSDDGEPGGTAGLPIMEVLNKNQLDFVLVVVIRYFGGIKLGSGGLVRAYSKGVSELIQQLGKISLLRGKEIQIECTYENAKKLDYQLRNISDVKRKYQENVIYTLQVDDKKYQELVIWNPLIIGDVWIEKDTN